MKKFSLYFTLLGSVLICFGALRLLKGGDFTGMKSPDYSITRIVLSIISSSVYVANIRKIKFNISNLHFLKSQTYLKVSIIILIAISLFQAMTFIVSTYRIYQLYPNRTVPIMAYLIILITVLYLSFMIKNFIDILGYSKKAIQTL